ncbi:MAG: hypothetical protein H6807_16820 [Planctomycetes bacterium]|nr:hypothetical protein [Planctomycetota bacterium]
MNGVEKVAILFRVLGTDFAKPMCEKMRPEEISRVGEAMVRFEQSPPKEEEVKKLLHEFRSMMTQGGIFANVNETLHDIFVSKFGEDQGPRILEEVRVNAQVESPFKGLQGVPFADLERILSEEHPQVQAAVLANIGPELAAGVLGVMDEERRAIMVKRIATMKPPPPRVLRDIADMFIEKTSKLPRFQEVAKDGPDPSIKTAADILNAASGSTNEGLLERIEEEKPDLAETIRETMFTFGDLATVDKLSMQKILGGIDTKLLALALKACRSDVSDAIFAAVSSRTKDMLIEEKELLGAVPLNDVRNAQREIMQTIRGLIDSGELKIQIGGGSAQLVE